MNKERPILFSGPRNPEWQQEPDRVKADAARWWGVDNAPISVYSNPTENDCYKPNQETTQ